MKYFLIIMVASIFLGTEIFAIPTPFAQLTIYRIFALSVPVCILFFVVQKNTHIKLKSNSYATFSIYMYITWWLWSIISVLWAENMRSWLQAVFLLTLGVSSILGIYFFVKDMRHWRTLIKTSWFMMSLLVLLGYYEIITNHYLFADMSKLDKYNTFSSQPMTRIPITHFENQNDFATMLLAYITVSLILFKITPNMLKKMSYILGAILGAYLIFRSGSRMVLMCLFLYFGCSILLEFKWDLNKRQYIFGFLFFILFAVLSITFIPRIQYIVNNMIYTGPGDAVTGDTGRINLLRNGIIFLASTFGLGVGAGNIEFWMANYRFLPTLNIVNLHHWWGEILIAYGVFIFIFYVVAYGLLIYRLFQIRNMQNKRWRKVTNHLITFLYIYIFASVTSANNMLIEWHWLFFGLIISYIKINEIKIESSLDIIDKSEEKHEFKYGFK